MDYTDAIKAIIKADATAKELEENSRKMQEEYPKALEQKLAAKKAEIGKRVEERIKKSRATEEVYKKAQIEELEKKYEKDSERLEKLFAENRDSYVETVFLAVKS